MRVSSPQGRSGDLADLVVDPSPAAPLDRDLVTRAGPLHLLVVDLHRLDVLGELGGVPVEPDGVAYRELSGGQTGDGDVGGGVPSPAPGRAPPRGGPGGEVTPFPRPPGGGPPGPPPAGGGPSSGPG